MQVLGDGKNAIHLYERECSLQQRRQKGVRGSASRPLDAATRQRLCESAAQLARSVGYRGAGTLEFLYDDSRGAHDFYFIEMNTRIQVEHPITEAVTGVDLVRGCRIADGERCAGASRISRCAARPSNTGSMRRIRSAISRPARAASIQLRWPGGPGVRVDSMLYPGCTVSPYYDSLLAKLIVWDEPWRGVGPAVAGAG